MDQVINVIQSFDLPDLFALIFFVVAWVGYAHYSENPLRVDKSLVAATNHFRLQWMREMAGRENRSVDIIAVGNLTRTITFFASTTIFILVGLISLLGYHDRVNGILSDIPFAQQTNGLMWEIKIFLLLVIFIYAFFKHTWSIRQYNYAGIVLCATPDYLKRLDEHEAYAVRCAGLIGNAGKHFNYGLRAYYYGLAGLSWFVHPYFFVAMTSLVIFVTHRREFNSATLHILSR